jgi:hypothetical protein
VLFGGEAALSGDAAEEATELHLATERGFAELLKAAAPERDETELAAFAHAIGGAAHQLAQWWLRTTGIPRSQVVEWYCAATWTGLRPLLERPAKP